MHKLSLPSTAIYFLLAIPLLFLACDNEDDSPMDDPVMYPITFELTDYDRGLASYYAINGEAYTVTDQVSTAFQAFLQEEVINLLLPDAQDLFELRGIRLISDSDCEIKYYDFSTGEATWLSSPLQYAWEANNLTLSDPNGLLNFHFEYDESEERLDYCDWAFTYSFTNGAGSQDFNGPDFPSCQALEQLDSDDPVRAYILDRSFNDFDTLCVMPLVRQFYKQ